MYSQTSLIRSPFIQIPRRPEENSWLQIYSIRDASNITVCSVIRLPRLSLYFSGKRMCAVKRGISVLVIVEAVVTHGLCRLPLLVSG